EYGENQEEVFLGHSVARQQNISEETAKEIDAEIKKYVDDAHELAREILETNIDQLHAIANALLEYETLSGDEIRAIIDGKSIDRPDIDSDISRPSGPSSTVPTAGKRTDSPSGGLSGPEPQPEG
ncbi:MAG: cell division protein FtsH, partial [Pseudomonadota bacterium]